MVFARVGRGENVLARTAAVHDARFNAGEFKHARLKVNVEVTALKTRNGGFFAHRVERGAKTAGRFNVEKTAFNIADDRGAVDLLKPIFRIVRCLFEGGRHLAHVKTEHF